MTKLSRMQRVLPTALALLLGAGCQEQSPDSEQDAESNNASNKDSKGSNDNEGPTPKTDQPKDPSGKTKSSKAEPSAGPEDSLFKPHRVLNVEVELPAKDWEVTRRAGRDFGVLIENCESKKPTPDIFDYVKATVRVDGEELKEVGVRKKGFLGSLSVARPSLKLKFNEYNKSQRFHGTRRLTLNNNFQDFSAMRSCLAYEIFQAAKVPAPRCNFAVVKVNGEAMGVYSHVESIRKPFLRRHFGNKIGPLFESQAADFRKELISLFEPKLGEDNPDYGDMLRVADALDQGPEEILKVVEDVFDLDAFIRYWAAESLVAHWDGFAGSKNNAYLYRSPKNGKFYFIPWGADTAFSARGSVIGTPPDDRGSVYLKSKLMRRMYVIPEIRGRYQKQMRELLDTVWNAETWVASIDRSVAAIRSAGAKVDQAAVDSLKWYVMGRKGQIETDLPGTHLPKQELLDQCPDQIGELSIEFDTTYQGNYQETYQPGVIAASGSLTLRGAKVALSSTQVRSSPSYVNGRIQPGLQASLRMQNGGTIELDIAIEPINFKSGTSFKTHGIATMGTANQAGAQGFRGVISSAQFTLDQAAPTPGAKIKGRLNAKLLKAVIEGE